MKTFFKVVGVMLLVAIFAAICFVAGFIIKPQQTCEKAFCNLTESEKISFCPTRIQLPMNHGGCMVTYICSSSLMIMEAHELSDKSIKEFSARLEYYSSLGNQVNFLCNTAHGPVFEVIGAKK